MATTLNLIITDAGIAEVINAQHDGTAPVRLTQVGFGRGIYTPVPSQTELQDEIKRVSTISGGVVGDNIMHIQALDGDASAAYAVYEIGVYTASGTLFAVYSQPLPIIHKVADSEIMIAIDIILTGVEPTAVTVGDTNYTLAPATTSNLGVVELATNEEAVTGTDTERALTPAGGAAAIAAHDAALRDLFVTAHAAGSPTTGDAQTVYGVKTFANAVRIGNGNAPAELSRPDGLYIADGSNQIRMNDSANNNITLYAHALEARIGEKAEFEMPIKGILESLYANGVGGLFMLIVSLQNGVDGDGFSRGDEIYTGKSVGTGTINVTTESGAQPASVKFRPLQGVAFYQSVTGYTVTILGLRTA